MYACRSVGVERQRREVTGRAGVIAAATPRAAGEPEGRALLARVEDHAAGGRSDLLQPLELPAVAQALDDSLSTVAVPL